jgi:hypothetical protein
MFYNIGSFVNALKLSPSPTPEGGGAPESCFTWAGSI